jgi:hypothetical protein
MKRCYVSSPINLSHRGKPRKTGLCSRKPFHLLCCVFVSRRYFFMYWNRGDGRSDLPLALLCVCFTTLFLHVLEPRRRALWSFINLKAAERWNSPGSYRIHRPPSRERLVCKLPYLPICIFDVILMCGPHMHKLLMLQHWKGLVQCGPGDAQRCKYERTGFYWRLVGLYEAREEWKICYSLGWQSFRDGVCRNLLQKYRVKERTTLTL